MASKFDYDKEKELKKDSEDSFEEEDSFEDEDSFEEDGEDSFEQDSQEESEDQEGSDEEWENDNDDPIAELLFDILDHIGLEGEIEYEERKDHVRYHINGEGMGLLIGRKGTTLDALQFMVGVINARQGLTDYRVIIDVEGYRERREQHLRDLAKKMAKRASRDGKRVDLEPMPAVDRRVVHLELAESMEVKTFSEGSDPRRRIVIVPLDWNENDNYDEDEFEDEDES